jgi:putative addiction module component (TIGR02574 family)
MSLQEVQTLALELTVQERAELAEVLLETLEHPSQEEIERRWADVIKRRVEELRSGKVKGIPGDVVMKKLRAIIESDLPS